MNQKQAVYETRWWHTERQNNCEKRFNQVIIKLNRKGKIMAEHKWSLEDLNKLASNRFRPVNELMEIFKHRYTESELVGQKAKANALYNEFSRMKIKKGSAPKFSDEEFQVLYECRNYKKTAFIREHQDFLGKASAATINWYLDAIRAELRGVQTALPQRFYNLIRYWHDLTSAEPLIERGSKKVRADVKRWNKKKTIEEKAPEPSIPPAVSFAEKNTPIPEKNLDETKIEDSDWKPNTSCKMDPNFSWKDAQEKVGLVLGKELKLVCDNEAHIEGAEMVYRQMGLTEIKRVRILMKEY